MKAHRPIHTPEITRGLPVIALMAMSAIVAAFSAVADVYFPRMDGADISRAESWGGTLPGPDDVVVFTGQTFTVTASNNVTFGALWNQMDNKAINPIVFDLRGITPAPTLKFDGYRGAYAKGWDNYGATFRGGIFDFNGKDFAQATGLPVTYYGHGRSYVFSDGVVATNIAAVYLGYTSHYDLTMEITGGSKVYVKTFKFTDSHGTRNHPNWLKVTGGSLFHVSESMIWEGRTASWSAATTLQPDGNMFYKDWVEVSGEGSEIVLLKPPKTTKQYICGGHGGSKLIVKDGGKFRTVNCGGIMWNHFTRNNLVQVSNGGRIEIDGSVVGGTDNGADGGDRKNRVEVLADGTFICQAFYLGYSSGAAGNPGNTLVVSNGTFLSDQFYLGLCEGKNPQVGASNQLVVIQGPRASFTPVTGSNKYLMFRTPGCEYRVELGAVFKPKVDYFSNTYITNCTVRVRNGGVFDIPVEFKTSASNPPATDPTVASGITMAYKNGLIAEDGGIVTGSCIRVMGYMSTIRVDDSSLVLTNSADALSIGYSNKYGGAGTNCFFEVAGAHPNVSLSGNLSVQHASTIKFELPAEGYDEGVKPIVAEGDVSMGATSAIAFTGTAEIAANRREIGKSADYVLIENPSNKAFLSDDAVAAAQAELGEEDFKLFKCVVGGRNQLVLRVKGHPGTIIMVR